MTGSRCYTVQIIPEAGMDEKYKARIRAQEAETTFSETPHLEKHVPVAELKAQLNRLEFNQQQIDSALAGFAHERSTLFTVELAPNALQEEGFTQEEN